LLRDAAVRRFTAVWAVSLAAKLVALAVFILLAAKLLGGF
jgi:hypothetical protein